MVMTISVVMQRSVIKTLMVGLLAPGIVIVVMACAMNRARSK